MLFAVRPFAEQDVFPQLCNVALYLGLMIVGSACLMVLVDRRQVNSPRVMPLLFQFTVAVSLMIIAASLSLFMLLELFDRLQLFRSNSVAC
jgi:hypothetical protein